MIIEIECIYSETSLNGIFFGPAFLWGIDFIQVKFTKISYIETLYKIQFNGS